MPLQESIDMFAPLVDEGWCCCGAQGRGDVEIAWAHTDGYGYVTLHLMPHDHGAWVILSSGVGEHRRRANVATIHTIEEAREIHRLLSSFAYPEVA